MGFVSLVTRPLPFTRYNGLANQVSQLSWSSVISINIQNVFQLLVQILGHLVEMQDLIVVREVLRNNLTTSQPHWSLPHFGNRPKKFDLVHQTVSYQKVYMG